MLREIQPKQIDGEHPRRWFSDDDFDLIVWLDQMGKPSGFQLCYRIEGEEKAVTWNQESGLFFSRVDTGDETARKNQTPILLADGGAPDWEIVHTFREACWRIDLEIRDFVVDKLHR